MHEKMLNKQNNFINMHKHLTSYMLLLIRTKTKYIKKNV